jgi:hypothetical protein
MEVDSAEADGGPHGHSGSVGDKRNYRFHKYKLQHNPYENENIKNNKNDDNQFSFPVYVILLIGHCPI